MPSTPHILDAAQLPLIQPFISRLGLEKLIDAACPAAAHAHLTHGQVVLAIVANRLCNPQAMSGILDWAQESGLGDIFGIDAAYLNDDRLARRSDAVAGELDGLQRSLLIYPSPGPGKPGSISGGTFWAAVRLRARGDEADRRAMRAALYPGIQPPRKATEQKVRPPSRSHRGPRKNSGVGACCSAGFALPFGAREG